MKKAENSRHIPEGMYGEIFIGRGEQVTVPLKQVNKILVGPDAALVVNRRPFRGVSISLDVSSETPHKRDIKLRRGKEIVVGRPIQDQQEPDLAVSVKSVSRRHASIALVKGRMLQVRDLDSTFGTGLLLGFEMEDKKQAKLAQIPRVINGLAIQDALESIGGNAGRSRSGDNAYFIDDEKGEFHFTNNIPLDAQMVSFRVVHAPYFPLSKSKAPVPSLIDLVLVEPRTNDKYKQITGLSLETRAIQHNNAEILEYLRAGGDPTLLPVTALMLPIRTYERILKKK